jgi:multimeric flavodoxin WrbA
MRRVLLVSTTTHTTNSTSKRLLEQALQRFEECRCEVRYVDASALHIVNNQSCYASGKFNCASFDAGKYRCWAHKLSHDDPEAFGGADQMGVLYDGFAWADIVVFATSVRWESHSAILQKVIERMTTLQNRSTVYGERNPLAGKRCGVLVTGHNAKAQSVASHLIEVFQWLGFESCFFYQAVWQFTENLHSEVPMTTDLPALEAYLRTPDGVNQMEAFIGQLLS